MHVTEQIQMLNGYIGKQKIYCNQGVQRMQIKFKIEPEVV